MKLKNFRIDDLEFVHTIDNPQLDTRARAFWRRLSDTALFRFKRQRGTEWCDALPGEVTIVFAAHKRGRFYGTFALYRVRRSGNDITAMIAPMFPEILDDEPDFTQLRRVMQWFLDNPLESEDGSTKLYLTRHRRVTEEDDCNAQHDWSGADRKNLPRQGEGLNKDRPRGR